MVFIFHYGSLKVKVEVVPGYDHYCHLLTISDYQIREIHSRNPASRRDFIPDPKFNLLVWILILFLPDPKFNISAASR